jgi:hypothetical protein
MHLFLGIFWAFYSLKFKRLWRSREWVEARRQELYVSQARRFRVTAVKQGGLLIKLGQFFSTRVDLLPQSSTRELAGLQDEVEPVAFEDISGVAEAEFGRSLSEVYVRIEKAPLASASLGQVHLGVLNQGDMVAIKIQRPGIENLVDIDLRAIRRAIDILKVFTEWEKMIDFDVIYQEFADTTWEELDYIQEGHNAEAIARNSAQDPDLIIPRIYWDYTIWYYSSLINGAISVFNILVPASSKSTTAISASTTSDTIPRPNLRCSTLSPTISFRGSVRFSIAFLKRRSARFLGEGGSGANIKQYRLTPGTGLHQ